MRQKNWVRTRRKDGIDRVILPVYRNKVNHVEDKKWTKGQVFKVVFKLHFWGADLFLI